MERKYIEAVRPLGGHVLQVDFVSGSRLLLDMEPYLDKFRFRSLAELDAVSDVVHGAVFPFGVRVDVVQIGQTLAQLGLRLEREHDVAVRAHDIAVALTAVHTAVDQIVDHVRVIADREAGIGHAVQRYVPAQRHGEHDLGHAVARRVGGDDRPVLVGTAPE